MEKRQALVQIKDLRQYFDIGSGKTVHSLNGINLDIYAGEALGIVGESGCGKSTLGKEILKINQPTNGEILYDGKWVAGADYRKHRLTHKERKEYCKKVQVVFQDPYSSLNPRHTAGKAIMRGLKEHRICPGKEKERTAELFHMVGLPEEMMNRYPHEFSGGQRQRICIARALAIEPELLICDEPISALDVSIQSQIINLLCRLKEELGLTMMFISHDLSVVRYMCDRVAVMYLGSIVEIADSEEIYTNPRHFYTKALLSAVMCADPDIEKERQRIILKEDLPSPLKRIKGCAFAGRCPYRTEKCSYLEPELKEVVPGHWVACHHSQAVYEGGAHNA